MVFIHYLLHKGYSYVFALTKTHCKNLPSGGFFYACRQALPQRRAPQTCPKLQINIHMICCE